MPRPTPEDAFANIQPDVSDENDERERRMEQSIAEMARTPGSGIAMCHEQGKTAVYLSEDKMCIVEHPPHGPTVAYFGSRRFGVEISREEAIRVTVRDLAERVQPGQIINDCGFTEAERRQMHHSP